MKYPPQAETPLSQDSNSAPLSRPQRSLLSIALCSAGLLGAIAAIPSAYAVTMAGLTLPDGANAQQILTFDSAAPATVTTSPTIAGAALAAGTEILVAIDYRPSNGLLYGVSNVGNIFSIDPGTGAATLARNNTNLTIVGSDFFGLDFNPTNDRLRLTSTNTAPPMPGTSQTNRAINVEDATSGGVTPNGELAYAVSDPNAAAPPAIEASAYTNSVTGPAPATTILYAIDTTLNILATQIPGTGVLTTVGSLGAGNDPGNLTSLDIASDGTAYAAFVTGAGTTTNLYTINLGTGVATIVGPIGAAGGPQVIGLSAVPSAGTAPAGTTVQFGAATFAVTEGTANAAITVTRSGTTTGTSSVQVATSDGTAVAGSDYTATTATVNFAANETTQTVNVPITDDATAESSETVTLTLSAPSAGTTLGTPTATLNIADNDSGGTTPPPAANNDDDGGCTVNPNGKDAGLLALLLSAAFVGLRRRWKK